VLNGQLRIMLKRLWQKKHKYSAKSSPEKHKPDLARDDK